MKEPKTTKVWCANPHHDYITADPETGEPAPRTVTRTYVTRKPIYCGQPGRPRAMKKVRDDACAYDARHERKEWAIPALTVEGHPDRTITTTSFEYAARAVSRLDVPRAVRNALLDGDKYPSEVLYGGDTADEDRPGVLYGAAVAPDDALPSMPRTDVTSSRGEVGPGLQDALTLPATPAYVEAGALDERGFPVPYRAAYWGYEGYVEREPTPVNVDAIRDMLDSDPEFAVAFDRAMGRRTQKRVIAAVAEQDPALALQLKRALTAYRMLAALTEGAR